MGFSSAPSVLQAARNAGPGLIAGIGA